MLSSPLINVGDSSLSCGSIILVITTVEDYLMIDAMQTVTAPD